MKTLKIFILILVFCLVSAVLSCWSGWDGLEVPDSKWAWIHSKIYKSPRQTVDYVFVGSSRTWCAVRSKQIENAFEHTQVWNFGRHWTGRDIDYLVIKALLEHHDVKHIFVEMIGQEDFAPHPYTKYLISPAEVVDEVYYHFKNSSWPSVLTYSPDFKERIKHIFNYMAELSTRFYRRPLLTLCANKPDLVELPLNDATGGFYADDSRLTQNKKFSDQYGRFQPFYPVSKGPHIIPPGSYPEYYLKKIRGLCKEYDTELSFAFISDFASVLPSDQMFHHFKQWGEIYIPTLRNIYKPEYWRDKNHLYQKGSEVLTEEIISLIKDGVRSSEDYQQYERR
ncbi:MAG: hypothetical protein AB7S78_10380 [Candidatus Omnitrophota bacterium]